MRGKFPVFNSKKAKTFGILLCFETCQMPNQIPMNTKRHFLLFSFVVLLILSYVKNDSIQPVDPETPFGTSALPINVQPQTGDEQQGWNYLRTCD
jgi:hypothetical protein